ncbi:MAG: GNAT family N-acetyltransferase [Microscillaceae bacterium]|nr:GNAT family N-acetyltransferase [Microscillaceae bacterium]
MLEFQLITLNDLDELIRMAIQTFRTSYEALNEPTNFADYLQKAFAPEQIKKEILHPHSIFYFLTLDQERIGYLKLNTEDAQTEDFDSEHLEIQRIYLLSEFQGRGYGQWMLQKAVDNALDLGKKYVWLGAWEKNPRAVSFYQKNGFEIIGAHDFLFGTELQKDFLLRKICI